MLCHIMQKDFILLFVKWRYKRETAISFAMGMVTARIIANKVYNISRLYHFTDSSRSATLKHGKMAPDWFGLDQYGRPFLFESKGTIEKKSRKNNYACKKSTEKCKSNYGDFVREKILSGICFVCGFVESFVSTCGYREARLLQLDIRE